MTLIARAALVLLLLSVPGLASATPLTLTFDVGAWDETITPENSGGLHGPYAWMENGARIEGFWATDVGTTAGDYQQGHLHPVDGRVGRDTGVYESTHSWTGDMLGLIITLDTGGTFDLVSIDYKVTSLERTGDPLQERLPWTYDVSDPHLLAATSYDPTNPDIEADWTGFAAAETAWTTLTFTGFDDLTSVLLTQTAHNYWLDNIVIEVHDMGPVPEPSTALLIGLGLGVLATGRRRAALLD